MMMKVYILWCLLTVVKASFSSMDRSVLGGDISVLSEHIHNLIVRDQAEPSWDCFGDEDSSMQIQLLCEYYRNQI